MTLPHRKAVIVATCLFVAATCLSAVRAQDAPKEATQAKREQVLLQPEVKAALDQVEADYLTNSFIPAKTRDELSPQEAAKLKKLLDDRLSELLQHQANLTLLAGQFLDLATMRQNEESRSIIAKLNLTIKDGLFMTLVFEGGPAAKAGIKAGDVIVSIAGIAVPTRKAVEDLMSLTQTKVTLKEDERYPAVFWRSTEIKGVVAWNRMTAEVVAMRKDRIRAFAVEEEKKKKEEAASAPAEKPDAPAKKPSRIGDTNTNSQEQPRQSAAQAKREQLLSKPEVKEALDQAEADYLTNSFIPPKTREELTPQEADKLKKLRDQRLSEFLEGSNSNSPIQHRSNSAKIAELMATAQANDSKEKGKTALAALADLLKLDPTNIQALALQRKIGGYYGPSKVGDSITNSIGMKLTYIPAGEFMMGRPNGEKGDDAEQPQHRVRLTKPFLMGVTEVTQSQWKAVMGDGNNGSMFKGDDLPMEELKWNDAKEFCRKLSAKDGREYRLPTEAEWEFACRAWTKTRFYSGDADGDLGTVGWFRDNSPQRRTHPVGQKKANTYGLYDMHGNAYEWCEDWFGPYPNGEVVDPTGPAKGTDHVLRGGSWCDAPGTCRAASRRRNTPETHEYDFGCRVVCDVTAAEPAPEKRQAMIDVLTSTKWIHAKVYVYSFRDDGTYRLEGTKRYGRYEISSDLRQIKLIWANETYVETIQSSGSPQQWKLGIETFVPNKN